MLYFDMLGNGTAFVIIISIGTGFMRKWVFVLLAALALGCVGAGSVLPAKSGSAVLDTRGVGCFDFSSGVAFDCAAYPEFVDLKLVGGCVGRPLMEGEWMHMGAVGLDGIGNVPEGAEFGGSEDYSRTGHAYIIRTREGEFAKIYITDLVSLQDKTGACDWQMSFDYVYQPGGIRKFGK